MAFPTITTRPLNFTKTAKDNSIRVTFEGGYEHRRQRFTRNVYIYTLTYDLLEAATITAIKDHYDSVGTGTSFSWTDPDNIAHTVYYDSPPSWQSVFPGWYRLQPLNFSEL